MTEDIPTSPLLALASEIQQEILAYLHPTQSLENKSTSLQEPPEPERAEESEDEGDAEYSECSARSIELDNLRDIRNLSRTCSYFWVLLAPFLLKNVCLRNESKSVLSIDALARGKHRNLVEEIHYIGFASPLEGKKLST